MIKLFLWPFFIVPIIAYKCSSYKDRIDEDLDRFFSVHYGKKADNKINALVTELFSCIEFRNLFYYRCGRIGRKLAHLSLFFLPTQKLLFFGVDRSRFMGGGIYSTWLLYCDNSRFNRKKLLGKSKCYNSV